MKTVKTFLKKIDYIRIKMEKIATGEIVKVSGIVDIYINSTRKKSNISIKRLLYKKNYVDTSCANAK